MRWTIKAFFPTFFLSRGTQSIRSLRKIRKQMNIDIVCALRTDKSWKYGNIENTKYPQQNILFNHTQFLLYKSITKDARTILFLQKKMIYEISKWKINLLINY